MLSAKTPLFRAASAMQAVLTLVFLCGGEYSRAWAAEKRTRLSLQEAARNLRVDEGLVVDPEGWEARRQAASEERRRQALERMREHAGGAAQESRARAARAEAEAVQRATPEAAVRHELARARAEGLRGTKLRERLSRVSPGFAQALRQKGAMRTGDAPKGFTPERVQPPRFSPPPPRQRGPRGALTPELKALYASVAGEGVGVEMPDGGLLPVEWATDVPPRPPVRLAGLASDVGLMLPVLGALQEAGPEDLAETPETAQTAQVKELAERLGGKPLALYNWVHTRVLPEVYYGSKKGAAATLAEGRGNDFDQASLLVALLRASGVPARYEYATVRLSLAQARSLTGEQTAEGAALRLARGGVPAGVGADGRSVLTERAYVRAYVPYGNWRGTGPGGERLWVRLDPGMKRVERTQGVDLGGLVPFDVEAYLSAPKAETPLEVYERQVLAAAQRENLCNTLEEALEKEKVLDEDFRLLPAEHPARVEESLLVFARPPEAMRHRVRLELGGQALEWELAELQGKRLAVRYVGATAEDEAALAAGMEAVVPYRVKVVPVVRLEGQEVRRLAPTMPGTRQRLLVRVEVPGGGTVVATHRLVAGGVYALRVSGGTTPAEQVEALQPKAPLVGEEKVEAQAHLALARYAHRQETAAARLFALQRHSVVEEANDG